MGKNKETVVKDRSDFDELVIFANYVLKSHEAIFTTSHPPELKSHGDSVSLMFYDMALLYLKHSPESKVICVASFFDECSVSLVAEFMNMLKDIFKENVYVNEDSYIQDPVTNELIWGRDNIDNYHERVWGRKITHTIMFDDTMAGHS